MATRSLKACLSPNGELVAVASHSHTHAARVFLLPTAAANGLSNVTRTTLSSKRPYRESIDILFSSNSSVVALLDNTLILSWDIERGVVDYEIAAPSSVLFRFVAACNDGNIGVLVESEGKFQIHEYRNGKIQRKIKAGKSFLPRGLSASQDYLVIRHEHGIKVLKAATGKKVSKAELSDGKNVTIIDNKYACTTTAGKILLVDLQSGRQVSDARTHADASVLCSWENKTSGEQMLTDGVYVYKVNDRKGLQLVMDIMPKPNIEKCIVLGNNDILAATLYCDGQYQTQTFEVGESKSIKIEWRSQETIESEEADRSKRKLDLNNAALGPGQKGGEASVADQHQAAKRKRKDDTTKVDDLGENADSGPSIEKRLSELRKAMEVDTDEDDDEKVKDKASYPPKNATTESLTELLNQALQSADDSMLELALAVVDQRIITETCQTMDPSLLPPLLNALTMRLATKPTRALPLCTWIRAVLLTGKLDSIAHLQPLRNIIQERVEAFPTLLMLDGRLSMIGKI